MLILGIETSCDETAAAVVKNGRIILSSAVSSSVHLHQKFGGIVPEIASRFHLEYIVPVTKKALETAGVKLKDIDLIAVTSKPGLVGSLWVGLSFAKGLSLGLSIPFIGVNHVQAHLFSSFLNLKSQKKNVIFRFPFIGLAVSGGHTSLAYVRDFDKIKIIGRTRDDAAGESFDKVAKILHLGYPGGPLIDRLAKTVSQTKLKFSCAKLEDSLDFSFSGIKTDVLYKTKKLKSLNKKTKAEIASAFQTAVVDILIKKSLTACRKFGVNILSIGGGVACNSLLRDNLRMLGKKQSLKVMISEPNLCVDNAAMIAVLGYYLYKKGLGSKYTLSTQATID